MILYPSRLITRSDFEHFGKSCSRHIKSFAIDEKNAHIYINLKFNFWYGLFFGRKTKNWIMESIEMYKPIGCKVTMTLVNRWTL